MKHESLQKEAADSLGLKPRMIQYYEKGERNGDKVKIPNYIALACAALQYGVRIRDDDDDSFTIDSAEPFL